MTNDLGPKVEFPKKTQKEQEKWDKKTENKETKNSHRKRIESGLNEKEERMLIAERDLEKSEKTKWSVEWEHETDDGTEIRFISEINKKEENQDGALVIKHKKKTHLMLIDGVGGSDDGYLAAKKALETASKSIKQDYSGDDIFKQIDKELKKDFEKLAVCGTMIILDEKTLDASIISIGDTRAFVIRNGEIKFPTEIQTKASKIVNKQNFLKEANETYTNYGSKSGLAQRMKATLEGALGAGSDNQPHIQDRLKLQSGDLIIMGSDGALGDNITDEKVVEKWQNSKNIDEFMEDIIRTGKERSADNVSFLSAKVSN